MVSNIAPGEKLNRENQNEKYTQSGRCIIIPVVQHDVSIILLFAAVVVDRNKKMKFLNHNLHVILHHRCY